MQIIAFDDPVEALAHGREFLLARPTEHNLLLTILEQSREYSLGGRFWVVQDDAEVVGFALESPIGMGAVLSRMPTRACHVLTESVAAPLPRVVGEAAVAAAFAGRWTELHSTAVTGVDGQRLYELKGLQSVASAAGSLRLAHSGDRTLLVEWMNAFIEEADIVPQHSEEVVDLRIERKQFWVWDHDGVVSMASASEPAADVARVQYVYTPPERRRTGYATACVEHMSRELTERGLRCVLYTDLANPTSNSIYRRLGYEAITEILGYDFA